MNFSTANDLLLHVNKANIIPYNNAEKIMCFNNKEMNIEGTLQLDLNSGSFNATSCWRTKLTKSWVETSFENSR